MNDQIREYTEDVVYIMVTKEFYDTAQEYKKGDTRRANFGYEPLDVIPFQITDADRIYSYRCHLLKVLGFIDNRKDWIRFKEDSEIILDVVDHDLIASGSDNDFMDKVEELNPTIDFRLK